VTLNNTTLSGNNGDADFDGFGWGLLNDGGVLNCTNSIVAGNFPADISGALNGSNNLIGGDPLLAPLGDYGGPTQTMPPLLGSPAVNAGLNSVTNFLTTDQRGFARVVGNAVDIGAVEAGSAMPGADYTVVTTTNDYLNGFGFNEVSLRAAVAFAARGSTITFTNTLAGQTITLTNGQITVDNSLTIDGSALVNSVLIDGNANGRIFEFASSTTNTLVNLTLTNGLASGSFPANAGGAIYLNSSAPLTLNSCTLSGNAADSIGGGIYKTDAPLTLNNSTLSDNSASDFGGSIFNAGGTVTLNNSTLSGNEAGSGGGGIFNNSLGTIALNNSTLSDNSAGLSGGGISNGNGGTVRLNNSTLSGNTVDENGGGIVNAEFATVTLNNSTLSDNSAGSSGGGIYNVGAVAFNSTNTIVAGNSASTDPDVRGTLPNGSNNLINGDPLLAPLGDYGGPTQTMPPLTCSPAIDAGDNSVTNFLTADQRGLARLRGGAVDIGAVEIQLILGSDPLVLTGSALLGDGRFQFSFTNLTGASFCVLATTNVALPLTNWMAIGTTTENPPGSGQFQFTDPDATNFTERYYRVTSP
jgi:hypothetical protein